MKSSIRAALAVGALALASTQSFASTVNVNLGMTPEVVFAGPQNLDGNPNLVELNVGSSGSGFVGTYFQLLDTDVDFKTVNYTLYEDAEDTQALGSWVLGAIVGTWSRTDVNVGTTPAYFASLVANAHYVLKLELDSSSHAFTSSTQISAVPLPAAAWLFGSALLGLGAMRRKQKAAAKSEMALA
jgi:hypothetical protein